MTEVRRVSEEVVDAHVAMATDSVDWVKPQRYPHSPNSLAYVSGYLENAN